MPKDGERREGGRKGAIGLINKVPDQGPAPGGGDSYPAKMKRDNAEMERRLSATSGRVVLSLMLVLRGFVAELVFFDLPVEGGKPDIEQAGGLRLITAGMVQHSLYMKFFDAGEIEGG